MSEVAMIAAALAAQPKLAAAMEEAPRCALAAISVALPVRQRALPLALGSEASTWPLRRITFDLGLHAALAKQHTSHGELS